MLHYKYSGFQISYCSTGDDKLYIRLEVGDDFPLHAYSENHLFKHRALNLRTLILFYHSSDGQEIYMKLLWIFVTKRTGNIFDS